MLKLERFAEGLKDIDSALKLDSSPSRIFITRARLHVGLELYEEAIEDFNTIWKLDISTLTAAEREGLKSEIQRAALCIQRKTYYQILGLTRTCTAAEIKKAFHRESLKHHPDRGGVAEKFKLVAKAYSVLSDPNSRREYDDNLSGRGEAD